MIRIGNFISLTLFGCIVALMSCKNTQTISEDKGVVKVVGYGDDDSPVGAVLVTTMGGGAPAVILAQPADISDDTKSSEKDENADLKKDEKITFDSLFLFERNSYQITPSMEDNLSRIIRILKRHENANVFIEGYKKDIDLTNHNLSLSEKRAKAIADYLVHHSIMPDRIQPKGYADTQPLFSNKAAQGRIKNRRVEVSVIARSHSRHKNSRE